MANVLVLLGYAFFALVLKENRYASRIIEVETQQQVITTGPYAWVRHPMYLAVIASLYQLTAINAVVEETNDAEQCNCYAHNRKA